MKIRIFGWNKAQCSERNELLFEKRNKNYGAYILRNSYVSSLLISFILGNICIFFILILQYLIIWYRTDHIFLHSKFKVVDVTTLVSSPILEQNRLLAPPPIEKAKIIIKKINKYTIPEVAKDEEIKEEQLPPTQDEVAALKNYNDESDLSLMMEDMLDNGEQEDDLVYSIVDNMPTFMGHEKEAFRMYIIKSLRYPDYAIKKGMQGRVYVQFVVNKKGDVENVKLLNGIDPILDNEVIRVVRSSPRWEPGKQKDKLVAVLFTFPINFMIPK